MQKQETNRSIESSYDDHVMPIWKSLNVPVKRASGCTLEDFDGNEYLDVFSGISVTNVGHGNEAVVKAAKAQLEEFIHGCSYVHPNEPVADLAETIADITPGDLEKSFFCNSGTEAVEGAIKLARKYTGSKEVIALEMGFHGRTLGSLALTGNNAYKQDMAPTINDVSHTAPPYAYRCPRCNGAQCNASCADQLERVIGSHTSGDLAAVVVEPVMGEAGIIVPSDAWLKRVQEIAHDHGALLIADEVQTGYGRTGKLFASSHFDIEPDILTQAKGIANGLPLGAFTASKEVADAFEAGDHLSTFGGNPVACAAALATIDELRDEIITKAHQNGEWLASKLETLEADYDVVGETRGLGLMQGIELVEPGTMGPQNIAPRPDSKLASATSEFLRKESNVVIGVGGYYKNVMRFQPPLTISRDQLGDAVEALRKALENVA
ncbi:4-aminobutyrate aminotransferase [Haladaptatus paucihalophilus DX253]|uniref:4-aminobutyrate aminotransferase n=1 Tax=Haladaptatus paucihalophilus DX253 TaxID=797209 RepID=E7QWJ8_HALPU|nr:aspartate aminotransferase family protein [Haladaptatus paucihalophilus]EFW91094.1 4-aminobutyrate aminotransferase [Haladaptatus paucihalophilus DX253]SHL37379.1 4-aminobutyrate aminotransferase / (S)-3-amino-2-methylpropionate transaminase [Haladaptatus paucihalophilus DX253]